MDKTTSQLREISQCKREIELEIPASVVKKEFDETLDRFARQAKFHGFRPGKVPVDIVKRKHFQDIKDTLINNLVPKAVNLELKSYNLKPVSSPVVTDISFQEELPLKFKAEFEVWPEFDLPEYKNIEVKKNAAVVSSKDVEKSMEDLRERSMQYIPAEGRGVKDGDYVVTEIQSRDIRTNKSFPKEKVVILAGHPDNEKQLNDNLLGLKSNESNNFEITYPEDHKNRKLAGKDIAYSIKVVSIKEKILPEIDDNFAKELGDFDSLKDLRKKIKSELKASKENSAQRELTEEILRKVTDKVNMDLPESLVEEESVALARRALSMQPQEVQQALTRDTFTKMKEEMKDKAIRNLKNHLVLTKIAEKENITVTDVEISNEMKQIAKANKVSLSQVSESVKKEDLKDNLLFRKTVDFLVKNAKIEGN
jgi:trigger factor